ncbi:putative lipid II flippase FtsW [Tepidicaulis sp. LMO-SS28]|uniref:putative lipid II flippase FtsW n=1 Tax=Tepidicaulis sp. LMO-SS28 TaxID=3447455 RepID=UPI003EE3E731
MIRLARTNRTPWSEWWWTVDRWTLVAIAGLIIIGILLSLAASPAVAQRLGLPGFHFVYRHLVFLVPAILVLVGTSMLNVKQVRRLAAIVLAVSLVLMLGTLVLGAEVKGATRWLNIGPFSLQPSEFAKPAFAVLAAWLFSEGARGRIPGAAIAFGLYAALAVILALQPDFGQLSLLTLVFAGLFFLSGLSWFWIGVMGGVAAAGSYAAYSLVPHVTSRVDRFLNPESGDTYQIDRALDAFRHGGFFGVGPGEGEVKQILPDAHTDFIFAVAAEEYGVLAGLLIIGLFGFIVLRTLARVREESDLFVQLATTALVVLIGVQALINMAVNVNLMPAKGMTLPFISYGGSSLLAVALTLGMLLALTRRRAGARLAQPDMMGRAYA